jgi:uncharacterized protein
VVRLLAWRGVAPDRLDTAWVLLGERRLSAHGSSTAAGYVLSWRLETGEDWVTRDLHVRVDGGGELHLRREAGGRWSVPGLDAALDCDLGLCPFTNTMPILRHGLQTPQPPGRVDVELVMAWVSVPDLTVSASRQRYRSDGPGSGGNARVRFDSEGFSARIEVDASGFVVDYPGIGRRL